MGKPTWITVGPFRALIKSDIDTAEFRKYISDLPELLSGPEVKVLQAGRHRTLRFPIHLVHGTLDVVVKEFGHQSPLKDLWDRSHGTKAFRTFSAALYMNSHGIGTIPPVACLEQWSGARLVKSFFISLYLPNTVCMKDHLADIWHAGNKEDFKQLLKIVAKGIRQLHDAGCTHGDLGNQNIELVKNSAGTGFSSIAFLDLNRSRFGKTLTIAERAKDLARIALPYGLYEEFFKFYWQGDIPADFETAYRRCRFIFRLHGHTRRFRHPLRELKYRRRPETAPAQVGYPKPFTVTEVIPQEGVYTDKFGNLITHEEVCALPAGTKIYRFEV